VPRRRPPAGKQLRASLDAALAAASRELAAQLEFSEQERLIIDRAAAAADRGEQLQRLYHEHLAAGETALAVKVSAELRGCERAVIDAVGKVNAGLGTAKSTRHQRAARSRWDRRDAAWAAARREGA
jgi:hypothetical protein